MNPTPEQIAAALAEEREAEVFVAAQWKAADEYLAAEWPDPTDREEAIARSIWTELARRQADSAPGWQPIKTAPRDGTNILLAWGQDGVSQGCYVPGWVKPWRFLDTQDGITWLVNHAVDNEYGPTHWQPLPVAPGVDACAKERQG